MKEIPKKNIYKNYQIFIEDLKKTDDKKYKKYDDFLALIVYKKLNTDKNFSKLSDKSQLQILNPEVKKMTTLDRTFYEHHLKLI